MLGAALVGGLVGAGILLNQNGRQSREIDNERTAVDNDEQPNQRNAYHSERYYDTWNDEFGRATKAFLKSRDVVNENVLPLYSNQMSLRQEVSPEMQAYLQKRGQRTAGLTADAAKKSFINEGGSELSVEDSPMFRPMGFATSGQAQAAIPPPVTNRPYGNPNGTAVSKEEHFQSYTISGPANSNDPNWHNNLVPFFGSRIRQNTDPEANQSLLETYTGQTNNVTEFRSKPKREMPSFADRTPGQTFIYGTPVEVAIQPDRYITSNFKTSITPFQQIRVGRGISNTYDAKPRDGFHSFYRPPDRNVDEIRVNPKKVYEGRLLPGAEMVQNRGIEGDVYKNRPDRFYVNDQRRWNKTTGSFVAPQIRENYFAQKQNREDTNLHYVGPAGNRENLGSLPGVYQEGSGVDNGGVCDGGELGARVPMPKATDMLLRDGPSDPELTGELESGSSCTLASRVQHTDRQQLRAEPYRNWGAQSYMTKQTKVPYDKVRANIRDSTYVRDYMGQAQQEGNQKIQQYQYDAARPNIRSTTNVRDYMGQVQQEGNQKITQYQYDAARSNIRDTTNIRDYMGQVQQEGNQKITQYQYDAARANTRDTTNLRDYQGIVSAKADNQKAEQRPYDKMRANIRDTTHVRDYQGIVSAKADNQKSQKRPYDKARNNVRNTTYCRDYVGVAGSVQTREPMSYEDMYAATARNNQEGLLESRAYGPNKATNITAGACDVNIQIKARTGYDITRWGPNEDRQYQKTPGIETGFTATTTLNQRGLAGARQPEDFVVEAFNRNPYTQSLTSSPSLTSPFRRDETPFNGCSQNDLSDPSITITREKMLRRNAPIAPN